MSNKVTNEQIEVIRKIIYAVETGGLVYGKANYDDFTEAYTNSSAEHSITIGSGQWYGENAKKLLNFIRSTNSTLFTKLDTVGIANDLDTQDWSVYKLSKTSAKAKCIQKIINSDVGVKCQDELLDKEMISYMKEAKTLGVTEIDAQMMCANFRHQGGLSAMKRIVKKTNKPYTLDNLYSACQTDTGNQVGTYKSRQDMVYKSLKKYVTNKSKTETSKIGGNIMTEKDIIICGHGSGVPTTKVMYTYLSTRYNKIAKNGKHKGIVSVKRLKTLTDAKRKEFHDTYKTILGRNVYSQTYRNYVFTKLNGKYYSDCSSSGCATFRKIGMNVSLLNTAGIYNSPLFETVNVKISNGHITNPEVLKVGDALLFVGDDSSRPLQIGHVEFVYEIKQEDNKNTNTTTKPQTTSLKVASAKSKSSAFSKKYKTTDNLNIRVNAGTSSTKITTIPKGETVSCYGYYTKLNGVNWLLVEYGKITGFVSSKYLK